MAILKSFRIMLVEDSATSAELTRSWLEGGLGTEFILHRATRVSAALELLQQKSVDLTILDLNLPDSLGLDTFRSILWTGSQCTHRNSEQRNG